jgi:hypothetical protein
MPSIDPSRRLYGEARPSKNAKRPHWASINTLAGSRRTPKSAQAASFPELRIESCDRNGRFLVASLRRIRRYVVLMREIQIGTFEKVLQSVHNFTEIVEVYALIAEYER